MGGLGRESTCKGESGKRGNDEANAPRRALLSMPHRERCGMRGSSGEFRPWVAMSVDAVMLALNPVNQIFRGAYKNETRGGRKRRRDGIEEET